MEHLILPGFVSTVEHLFLGTTSTLEGCLWTTLNHRLPSSLSLFSSFLRKYNKPHNVISFIPRNTEGTLHNLIVFELDTSENINNSDVLVILRTTTFFINNKFVFQHQQGELRHVEKMFG